MGPALCVDSPGPGVHVCSLLEWLIACRPSSLTTSRFPNKRLRPPLISTTPISVCSLEANSADLLCQALKARRDWVPPSCPLRSPRAQEFPFFRVLLRTLTGAPSTELSVICGSVNVESIKVSRVLGEINGPPSRVPMPGKAVIQPGGHLVSQRAPLETD
jgi:hypothetical protein